MATSDISILTPAMVGLALASLLSALLFVSVLVAPFAAPASSVGSRLRKGSGSLRLYLLLSAAWTFGQWAYRWVPSMGTRFLPLPMAYAATLGRGLQYCLVPLALLFLSLTRQFVGAGLPQPFPRRRGLPWWGWLLGLTWLGVVVVLYEDLLALARLGLPPVAPAEAGIGQWSAWAVLPLSRAWLGWAVLCLGWGIAMFVAVALTLNAYGRAHQPLHRNRILYWPLPLALTAAGGFLFLSGLDGLSYGLSAWTWGSLLSLLSSVSLVCLWTTYRLSDVGRLARGVLRTTGVVLVRAGVYGALLLGILYASRSAPDYSLWMVGLALALVLAAAVHPLLDRMQRLLERTLSRRREPTVDAMSNGARSSQRPADLRRPQQLLGEYGARISNILELEGLAAAAVGILREGMGTQRGALFIVRREADGDPPAFQLQEVAGLEQGSPSIRLSSGNPVARFFQQEQQPLTQYDMDLEPRYSTMQPEEHEALSRLQMDVYVPICAPDIVEVRSLRWIGLLALGPKRSGERYFDDELSLLRRLASQTAVALQNARRFDDLRVRSAGQERRNQELVVALDDLARRDRGKIELFRLAARELRRPLADLQSYVDLLDERVQVGSGQGITPVRAGSPRPYQPPYVQGVELVEAMRSALQRGDEIAQTLQELARIEAEMLEPLGPWLKLRTIPLEPVVAAAAEGWRPTLEARNLTFSTSGLSDLPPILADGGRLQWVFEELIQNAIRATPDRGQIQVHGLVRDRDQPTAVEVVVADTGIGLAREDLERAFERYYRVGELRLDRPGQTQFRAAGPGLGLPRVRRIVEAHGGQVWLVSAGRAERAATYPGTEAHVALPVRGGR